MNNALYLSRQSETAIPISAGLTWRAVALGIGLAVPSTVWAIHASYVASSSQISVTHLPVAALFPFVCVALFLNPCLKTWFPGRGLTAQELIVIFSILLTASVIPGWAFSTYALSTISGPHYFASPENRWVELFVPYLPTSVK